MPKASDPTQVTIAKLKAKARKLIQRGDFELPEIFDVWYALQSTEFRKRLGLNENQIKACVALTLEDESMEDAIDCLDRKHLRESEPKTQPQPESKPSEPKTTSKTTETEPTTAETKPHKQSESKPAANGRAKAKTA